MQKDNPNETDHHKSESELNVEGEIADAVAGTSSAGIPEDLSQAERVPVNAQPSESRSASLPSIRGESGTNAIPNLSDSPLGELDVAIDGDGSHTVFDFARQFYQSKQPPSEQFKKQFGNLDGQFSQHQSDELLKIALLEDRELNRTLTLAEFLLETSVRREYRDKLIHFLQVVASNVGTLAKTPRCDEFQRWLDECVSSRNKLDRFAMQIERIRTVDADKPLPKNLKNNLLSIAAIWLYTREQLDIAQLIEVLGKEGMNIEGETGAQVDARAFAYVASMIKSTNRRRFAYFNDWVNRTRSVIVSQLSAERATSAQRLKHIQSITVRCSELEQDLAHARQTQRSAEAQLKEHLQEIQRLTKELEHRDIHHGAHRSSTEADHESTLNDILETVDLAKKAMRKEKWAVVDYQLEMIEDKLRERLS